MLGVWEPGSSWTRSELEERFIAFLDGHGIPRGVANAHVRTRSGWFECDHVWQRERLVVELNSYRHHGDGEAIERDSARRRALVAAGWRVVAVTWRQLRELREHPGGLADELRVLLGGAP